MRPDLQRGVRILWPMAGLRWSFNSLGIKENGSLRHAIIHIVFIPMRVETMSGVLHALQSFSAACATRHSAAKSGLKGVEEGRGGLDH